CRHIRHRGVDLPALEVRVETFRKLRQRQGLRAQLGEHVHGGEHAVVGTPEVAEVVVRRMFAAEDGTGGGHLVLDERVPDPGAYRYCAGLLDRFGDETRGDQVVDDTDLAVVTGCAQPGDFPDGDNGGDRRRGHRLPQFVDHEAAV